MNEKVKKQISHFEKGLRDEPMDTVWFIFEAAQSIQPLAQGSTQ